MRPSYRNFYSRTQAFPPIMGNGEVDNWTGWLTYIGTDTDGWANIKVLLPCGTKPGDNAPILADELLNDNVHLLNLQRFSRGTSLYSTLISLKKRSRIVFSGTFVIPNVRDYVSERSITESGSMPSPDFEFVFKGIAPDQ
jgi:hypothetical protein